MSKTPIPFMYQMFTMVYFEIGYGSHCIASFKTKNDKNTTIEYEMLNYTYVYITFEMFSHSKKYKMLKKLCLVHKFLLGLHPFFPSTFYINLTTKNYIFSSMLHALLHNLFIDELCRPLI